MAAYKFLEMAHSHLYLCEVIRLGAYDILEQNGLNKLIVETKYTTPIFSRTSQVLQYLCEIVDTKEKVGIIGDYDVDGLMCILILKLGLQGLGVSNIYTAPYTKRMHVLNPMAVQECIQNRCKYCIIADCGSHDLSLLRMLLNFGIKVILLDHHETMTKYDEFEELGDIAVINTTLESKKYDLSAGALCFCVMDALYKEYHEDASILSTFALVSLFADCMCMHSELNRSIYHLATSIEKENLPAEIRMFMNQYHKFNNRFITFWMAPRINAMFRSENLAVLNKLFIMDDGNVVTKSRCLQFMNEKYEELREMVHKIADLIEVEDAGGISIANMYSVNKYCDIVDNSLWNYTGLVANMLSQDYAKPAFVYCSKGGEYKGSVRDAFGRDLLTIFKQMCNAEGHKPAFGVRIAAFDIDDFLGDLRRVGKRLEMTKGNNEPVIIDYRYNNPDSALIEDIAKINEFAGTGVPMILLKKQLVGGIKEIKTQYNYKYKWGDYYLQSQHALGFGSILLLRPTKSWTTKLIVQ